jgi:DNA-binding transcriptional LysR family regulator
VQAIAETGGATQAARHLHLKALQALLSEHPEVELVLEGDVVGDAHEHLRGGHADFVLCVIPPGNVSALVRDHVKAVVFGEPIRVKHLLRLPVTEAVLDLVQAGLGVSILPGFTLRARVERGELDAVRLTRRGFPRSWSGVFRKGSPLDGPIRTLLDTLKRHGLPRAPHVVESPGQS